MFDIGEIFKNGILFNSKEMNKLINKVRWCIRKDIFFIEEELNLYIGFFIN